MDITSVKISSFKSSVVCFWQFHFQFLVPKLGHRMVTLTSEDTSQMETSQKTSAKKTRVFKRIGKFLVRLSKNKDSKSDDFAFNSIHRQYYSNTLKQYSSLSKEPSTSATCSRRSSQISKIADQNGPNLDTLPECILLHLFSYLNVQDVTSLGW